jgi:hypothetical protein
VNPADRVHGRHRSVTFRKIYRDVNSAKLSGLSLIVTRLPYSVLLLRGYRINISSFFSSEKGIILTLSRSGRYVTWFFFRVEHIRCRFTILIQQSEQSLSQMKNCFMFRCKGISEIDLFTCSSPTDQHNCEFYERE